MDFVFQFTSQNLAQALRATFIWAHALAQSSEEGENLKTETNIYEVQRDLMQTYQILQGQIDGKTRMSSEDMKLVFTGILRRAIEIVEGKPNG